MQTSMYLEARGGAVALSPVLAGSAGWVRWGPSMGDGGPLSDVPLGLVGSAVIVLMGVTILVVQLRHLSALRRLRAAFVAGVSHDLRTPLASIRLFSDLMEREAASSEAELRQWARLVNQESQRLAYRIEALLAFAAPHAGASPEPARRDRVELAPLAAEVAHAFGPLARTRRVVIGVCVPPPLEVEADRGHLRLILFALLDNAVKYGPAGQAVSIGAEAAGDDGVRLWVEDAGPGIPLAERERVWEPFTRLARPVEAASGGVGVGLALVRRLAAAQGGTTWIADPAGGAGVRVGVTLYAGRQAATGPGACGAEGQPSPQET